MNLSFNAKSIRAFNAKSITAALHLAGASITAAEMTYYERHSALVG